MRFLSTKAGKKTIARTALFLCFAGTVLIIFKGAHQVLNSDAATVLLLVNEQISQGRFFPDGWVYADSLWVISLNVFVLPFMLLFEDWMFCRKLAVIAQLICILVVLGRLGRRLSKKGDLLPFLFLIPLSPTILEHFFFQATYATHIIWYSLALLCVFFLVQKGTISLRTADIRACLCLAALFVIPALLEMSGIRHLLTFSAPLVGSLLVVGYQQWKESRIPETVRSGDTREMGLETVPEESSERVRETDGRRAGILRGYSDSGFLFCAAAVCMGIAVGMAANLLISQNVLLEHGTSDAAISQGYEILYRFGDAVGNILTVFGAVDYGTLVSANGVFKFLKAVYCIGLIVCIPISLWKKYDTLNVFQRIFYVYAMLSFALTMYVNVFTDIGHARYFLMIYMNSLILAVIWLETVAMDRYVRTGILLVTAVMGLYCYRHYLIYDYQENAESVGYYPWISNQEELLACLETENLTFGYATYWQSYNITALTSGAVQVLAVEEDLSGGLQPYYWLTNVNWYNEAYHTGRSFLLLTEEELELLPAEYQSAAEKQIQCGEYYILIYSYDILDEGEN